MQHDQDISIQITIKGVSLCITIANDEPETRPVLPVEILLPAEGTPAAASQTSSKSIHIDQSRINGLAQSKIQKIDPGTDEPNQASKGLHPAKKDAVIKGYRVKVIYDDSAPCKQELLKSIIQAGKKF